MRPDAFRYGCSARTAESHRTLGQNTQNTGCRPCATLHFSKFNYPALSHWVVDPETVKIVPGVVGVILFVTGIIHISGSPGMLVYLPTLMGIVLADQDLIGLKKGNVF